MPTASSAVPRSGSADYKVHIDGLAIDNDFTDALNVVGNGVLSADFATGRLDLATSVDLGEIDYISGHNPQSTTGVFRASGTISSTANTFSGNLTLDGIGNYSGTFDGSFFGPTAQEVAATWSAADGADKAIGTIIGAKDASLTAARTPLGDYTTQTTFSAITLRDHGVSDPATVTYNPATGAYLLRFTPEYSNTTYATKFEQTDIDPAKSDASRTWYDRGVTAKGYVFKPGDQNPVLKLTYATFADLQVRATSSNPPDAINAQYFVIYGNRTPYALLPRFGSATYDGIIRGRGRANAISYEGTFSGTATATANFADMKLGATVNIVADDSTASPVGTFSYTANIITTDGTTSLFRGFATTQNGASRGQIEGGFFGPNANEIGAAWFVQRNGLTTGLDIGGILIGKKN
ncbi:transferrin-binding protein-like solute binding protein [Novosphingobium subterraneum]|uniref:Transferrin binding protein-like solute binding protein n=1 Tax=Novosphingobium subterraneum TaxID=48936 RepID=A0A0B8ZY36_9SPHN|nr:transferrin-binding protein-like solute binding protein [Novosphingobium subterraneum]KHS43227.1 Transferrin binding protein-like solute binding protein [Novosphingobium subterraneum]